MCGLVVSKPPRRATKHFTDEPSPAAWTFPRLARLKAYYPMRWPRGSGSEGRAPARKRGPPAATVGLQSLAKAEWTGMNLPTDIAQVGASEIPRRRGTISGAEPDALVGLYGWHSHKWRYGLRTSNPLESTGWNRRAAIGAARSSSNRPLGPRKALATDRDAPAPVDARHGSTRKTHRTQQLT
jgi:hypothetical protein